MKSQLYTKDIVKNKDRRFGSAKKYQACEIDGVPALFTLNACEIAKKTAAVNPEDIPEDKGFWEGFFDL